jgi:hypothetical protein
MGCVVTLIVAGAGALAANAAIQQPKTGTIEICKASANGMSGKPFQFSINGAAPITVNGGACSGPLATSSGANTVVEAPTAGLDVASITSNNLVKAVVKTGTARVKVTKGSTEATETLVTYTNEPNAALGLKVCKAADPELVGSQFSFTENGKPAFSVVAGPAGSPNCSPVKKYSLGTVVHVTELPTNNVAVGSIVVSDNRGSNVNTAAGTVDATIGAGVTVVTYTNKVVPPTNVGFIELCKTGADSFVTGSFDYTITAPGFTASRSVTVGQCSDAVQVPAGNVSVAEAPRVPYAVAGIAVSPGNRTVSKNLPNGTVTVTVPAGDESTETLVTYTNATITNQVKVCKTLTSSSTALAGQTFTFTVTDVNGQHTDSVIAGAAGTTACIIDPSHLPLGSAVTVTENPVDNVKITGVAVAPASQDAGSSAPTARLTVGSGITIATFTNQAYGTVEVCKIAADTSTATQTFQFTVNGSINVSVPAGQCSSPLSVPVGSATVSEAGAANFHLVGVTAQGPTSDNRLVTASTANPATVSVPFGGVENETVVRFTNAVNTGEFKICKQSSEPTLQNTVFQFTYSYTLGGDPITGTASLKPTQCSSLSGDIPVVDANGAPIPVNITETATPSVEVSNIAVANGTLATDNLGDGTATIYVKQGFTSVTYTNVRTPVGDVEGVQHRVF